MRVHRVVVLALSALLLVGTLPGPASGTALACGARISEDVTFTEDLHCDGRFALVVDTGGVTLDLGGHTLSGAGILVDNPFGTPGVTVQNGTIRDWVGNAVLVGGEDATLRDLRILAGELTIDAFGAVELAARTTMAGVHVEGNQVGVHAEFSHGTTIRNSTFAGNGTGVFVKVGRDFVVRASRFLDNVHAGLLLWDDQVPGSVTDGLVTRNHFEGNGIGLDLAAEHGVTGNHVVGNQFRRNRGSGMAVTVLAGHGGGVGTVVEDNHFDRNGFDPPTLHRTIQLGGSPFDPDPAPPETVTFVADGGLKVVARPAEAAGITVTGNRAFFNAGLGIDAPGVVDGGGNHGRHNSDGAECDGVRCQPGRP